MPSSLLYEHLIAAREFIVQSGHHSLPAMHNQPLSMLQLVRLGTRLCMPVADPGFQRGGFPMHDHTPLFAESACNSDVADHW